ncbi:MAG: glucosyl-3-phosphoglycerate synthase [Chloroflexi bacterium]|nr:glucosyl-3-phosphoglycerate synthase [Chloroflexota bacterium]
MSPAQSQEQRAYTILVPIADLHEASDLIKMAAALMPLLGGDVQGRVVALGVVEIPEEMAFTAGAVPARLHRRLLGRLRRFDRTSSIELRTTVRVSRQIWHGIVEAAAEERADLILLGWKGWTASQDAIFSRTIDQAVRNAPCDIALVSRLNPAMVKRVLVPVRGGPHAELALRLAVGLANTSGGIVTALRIETPDRPYDELDQENEEFHAVLATSCQPELTREVVVRSGSVADAIVAEANSHQVIVMGAAAQVDQQALFGPIADRVARELDRTALIIVKTRLPGDLLHEGGVPLLPGQASGEPHPDLSIVVDKWFAENTFDSREFEDLRDLVRLKERQGLTVSLGLPTLNEEETIGTILRLVQTELVTRHRLLDEILIVDSGSTDRTRKIAEECGVPVVLHSEVLPEMGAYRGKGEALWKSLHVLSGDLVAWVDTDIKNFHPRFVYGILGPLLKDRRIKYVKGFYKRPISLGRGLVATGGGRVTELTARPLLNLFYPELSGVIQPLAGEYAARRDVLERVPFLTGYGVEIGLLIDLLERHGLQAIGQVDLKRRVHRNQSLHALSTMAFTITSVILHRLEQRGRMQIAGDLNRSMKLIQHEADRFHIEIKEMADHERPPIITVPAYAERRSRLGRPLVATP